VLISATALPPRMTLLIGIFAMLCATVLVFFHYSCRGTARIRWSLPEIYMVGVWLSILLAIGYIGVYTWQVAEEARQLSDALAATELVLAREQHLSQLDGLAAAAAHELGTPLSTITVVVREIERALEAQFALCRGREIAARAGAALPRDSGQDHRTCRRRTVRPHAALGADRGGGGAAPQFRRSIGVTCRPTARPSRSARAIRRSATASAI
jgi:signal transduction histidine kinase